MQVFLFKTKLLRNSATNHRTVPIQCNKSPKRILKSPNCSQTNHRIVLKSPKIVLKSPIVLKQITELFLKHSQMNVVSNVVSKTVQQITELFQYLGWRYILLVC